MIHRERDIIINVGSSIPLQKMHTHDIELLMEMVFDVIEGAARVESLTEEECKKEGLLRTLMKVRLSMEVE